MKNLNTRSVLLGFLIFASLCSYVFLQSESSKIASETIEVTEEQEQEQNQIYLPDVEMVKKAVQSSKTLLQPFTQ